MSDPGSPPPSAAEVEQLCATVRAALDKAKADPGTMEPALEWLAALLAHVASLRLAPPTGEEVLTFPHGAMLIYADGYSGPTLPEFEEQVRARVAALVARADEAEKERDNLRFECEAAVNVATNNQAEVARLTDALREIEAHHVESNQRKGRDESRSETLRIARAALKGSTP